jgi:hypothetical protein
MTRTALVLALVIALAAGALAVDTCQPPGPILSPTHHALRVCRRLVRKLCRKCGPSPSTSHPPRQWTDAAICHSSTPALCDPGACDVYVPTPDECHAFYGDDPQ